jgi:hypothetical protein
MSLMAIKMESMHPLRGSPMSRHFRDFASGRGTHEQIGHCKQNDFLIVIDSGVIGVYQSYYGIFIDWHVPNLSQKLWRLTPFSAISRSPLCPPWFPRILVLPPSIPLGSASSFPPQSPMSTPQFVETTRICLGDRFPLNCRP